MTEATLESISPRKAKDASKKLRSIVLTQCTNGEVYEITLDAADVIDAQQAEIVRLKAELIKISAYIEGKEF